MPVLRAITRRRNPALAVAMLVVYAVALVGCDGAPSSTAKATTIDVTMHDFGIRVSRRTVPAGTIVLHATNRGPSTHELNVDRSRYTAAKIPLQTDGITANESAKGLHRVDSIEQLNLHHTGDLTVQLRPGRYVLWCNLEGHYLGGMYETFDVR